jgi:hypothetical protein
MRVHQCYPLSPWLRPRLTANLTQNASRDRPFVPNAHGPFTTGGMWEPVGIEGPDQLTHCVARAFKVPVTLLAFEKRRSPPSRGPDFALPGHAGHAPPYGGGISTPILYAVVTLDNNIDFAQFYRAYPSPTTCAFKSLLGPARCPEGQFAFSKHAGQ